MIKFKKTKIMSPGSIDMTPITDTSFLLLIFFMVTTVFKNPSQLKMTLPDAWNPVKVEQVKITVEVDAGGQIAINGRIITPDQFDTFLIAEKEKTKTKSIVIRADQDTKHGEVLKLMKLAKGVGIETISLSVEDLTMKQASVKEK